MHNTCIYKPFCGNDPLVQSGGLDVMVEPGKAAEPECRFKSCGAPSCWGRAITEIAKGHMSYFYLLYHAYSSYHIPSCIDSWKNLKKFPSEYIKNLKEYLYSLLTIDKTRGKGPPRPALLDIDYQGTPETTNNEDRRVSLYMVIFGIWYLSLGTPVGIIRSYLEFDISF